MEFSWRDVESRKARNFNSRAAGMPIGFSLYIICRSFDSNSYVHGVQLRVFECSVTNLRKPEFSSPYFGWGRTAFSSKALSIFTQRNKDGMIRHFNTHAKRNCIYVKTHKHFTRALRPTSFAEHLGKYAVKQVTKFHYGRRNFAQVLFFLLSNITYMEPTVIINAAVHTRVVHPAFFGPSLCVSLPLV